MLWSHIQMKEPVVEKECNNARSKRWGEKKEENSEYRWEKGERQ